MGRAEGEASGFSCNGAGEIAEPSSSHYDFYWREQWSHRALRRTVVVSACLHAVVILFFPSARYKPKIIEFPPLYEVSLVQLEPERRAPPKKPEKKQVTPPETKAPKVVTRTILPSITSPMLWLAR